MFCFQVLKSWHAYAHSHRTGVQIGHISLKKNPVLFCWKTLFLRLYFWDEGHLYANFLFDILTFHLKCRLFQFFSCSIRMHIIPILTEVQKERKNYQKESDFLLKMFFVKLLFHDEGHLYVNCLIYILTIYRKCLFFSSYVRAYVCRFPS